jgi:GntR family transcriptional regulator
MEDKSRAAAAGSELPDGLSFERPKGEQLREILEGYIASLEAGTMLPSERLLAERFGVARMTVRNELERLAAAGFIYRLQGRGTFVAEEKIVQSETLSSFSEDMRARGMAPGSRVLSQERTRATEIVASNLELAPGADVVLIERVRTADGEPMAIERAFLPAGRFPQLEREHLADVSLYEVLESKFGVAVHHADQLTSAVDLDDEEAALLNVPIAQPAFLIQRVTRDANDSVIEYVRSVYRGDRYEIHARLHRGGA